MNKQMSKFKLLLLIAIGVGTTLFAGSTLLAAEDAVPPTISAIVTTDISTNSAKINWNTNEIATSAVRYGTSTNYGMFATSSALATVHVIPLSNLTVSSTYHFSVSSSDVFGNTATSTNRTFMTLATTTPPTATTTIHARLQITPNAINIKKPGKRIQALIRLPKGTTFERLDPESLRLNGIVKPVDSDLRPGIWRRWGKYRKTLIAKFKTEDILPLIPAGATNISLTITGNIKAGTFTATDSIKIVPKPKKIEIKIDKLHDRLEDVRERLKDRQEEINERLEKHKEKLKERLEDLEDRL